MKKEIDLTCKESNFMNRNAQIFLDYFDILERF